MAVGQVTCLVARLPAVGPVPLSAFDAGKDPLTPALGLAEARATVPGRLGGDHCCYADLTSQLSTGRPRRHGAKFACADPAT